MQDLPFQTITQFAALGLTLIAGWFFGLASTSGGRKWRERYQDLELDQVGYRDRAEQDLRDMHRKVRDLEAENAKLAKAAAEPAQSDGHSTATVAGAAVVGAAVGAAAAHAADDHHDAGHAAEEHHADDHHAAPAAEADHHAHDAAAEHHEAPAEHHEAPAEHHADPAHADSHH